MRLFAGLLILFLIGCSNKTGKLLGHWHELVNEETIHCYHISDTLVSVDQFTYGYSRRIFNGEIFQPMVANSSFELLRDKVIEGNYIEIADTVTWTRAPDNIETFINDLSLGLLVNVEPPELAQDKFELTYNTLATVIFIGQLKSTQSEDSEFYIQLNDLKSTVDDVRGFLISHLDNSDKIIILHADKNTPGQLMQDVTIEILKAGFIKQNIYQTVINKTELTMGLVQSISLH